MSEIKIFQNSADDYLQELLNKFESDLKPFSQETVLNTERLCELFGKSKIIQAILMLLKHRLSKSDSNKAKIDNILRLIEMYDDYMPEEIREESVDINLHYELSTEGES